MIILIVLVPLTLVSSAQAKPQDGEASTITWSQTYQDRGPSDQAMSVLQTSDKGFVVAGHSVGGWVFKLDLRGSVEWERGLVPTGYSNAWADSVEETRDKGYIVGGSALGAASYDAWLVKLDHKGNVQWSKTFGGPGEDGFSSVHQTSDDGYIAAGDTGSFGPGVQYSAITAWVFRLDPVGNVLWAKDYGADEADSVQQTNDGGFIVAGTVAVGSLPSADAWVFKLDPDGNMVWQKGFGITIDNRAKSVQQTQDGGYVVVAEKITLGPVENFLSSEALILRLDADGNLLWQRAYAGGGFTQPHSIRTTSDGGFIVASRANPGGPFLLKLDAVGNMVWQRTYGGRGEFFFGANQDQDGGFIVAGWLFTQGGAWVLKLDSQGGIRGCPLGVPANGTITDTNATIVDTMVQGLSIRATMTQTSVEVVTTQATIQAQCLGTKGKNATREKGDGNDTQRNRFPS